MTAPLGFGLVLFYDHTGRPTRVEAYQSHCPSYAEVHVGAKRLGLALTLGPWERYERNVGQSAPKWEAAWRAPVVAHLTAKRRQS